MVANPDYVLILNAREAVNPVTGYDTDTFLFTVVPEYILQDEKEQEAGIIKYYVMGTAVYELMFLTPEN